MINYNEIMLYDTGIWSNFPLMTAKPQEIPSFLQLSEKALDHKTKD